MADIEQNMDWWKRFDWSQEGENWSKTWGGSDIQFYGSILPRIRRYLPTGNILEIAPGFGRWTQYLLPFSQRLTGVDLNADCIEYCTRRFEGNSTFYQNDGKDLSMVPDDSIDFAYSFDSLVHVNVEVLEAYVNQLAGKLTANGVGFFHHSNLGMYTEDLDIRSNHYRDAVVNHEIFRQLCENAGLTVISQELINWGSVRLIDCLSVFTQKGSAFEQEYVKHENPKFMDEAVYLRDLSKIYRK
jgi:SAM-dependent methyltransferase